MKMAVISPAKFKVRQDWKLRTMVADGERFADAARDGERFANVARDGEGAGANEVSKHEQRRLDGDLRRSDVDS